MVAALRASKQQALKPLLQVSDFIFAFVRLDTFYAKGLPGSNSSTQCQPSDRRLNMCGKYEGSRLLAFCSHLRPSPSVTG